MTEPELQLDIFPTLHEGFRFALFSEDDISKEYLSWLNSPLHMRYSQQSKIIHTHKTAKDYLESFRDTPNLFLSIVYNDILIGTCTVYIDEYTKQGNIGLLVGPRHANKGLGKRIWKVLIDIIGPKIGLREAIAGTRVDNLPMISLFNWVGMIPIQTYKSDIEGQPHEVYVEYGVKYL